MSATVGDMLAALDGIGLPATQFEWPEQDAPSLPYAIIAPVEERSLTMDGRNDLFTVAYDVELYSRRRDVALELRVRGALADAGIQSRRDFYYDSEQHFCITYFHCTLTEQEA